MPAPPNVCDPVLYQKARNKFKHLRHSAYKSGLVVREYKRLGGRYKGKKPQKKGLSRWFKEEWRTQDGRSGYIYMDDIFRPTKRITEKTPTTFSELTKRQVKRARAEKASTGRVKRFKRLLAGDKKHERAQAKLLRTCKRKLKRKEKLGFTCTAKLKSKGILPSKRKRHRKRSTKLKK